MVVNNVADVRDCGRFRSYNEFVFKGLKIQFQNRDIN